MKRIVKLSIFTLVCFFSSCVFADVPAVTNNTNIDQQVKAFTAKAKNLNPKVVKLALQAYNKARIQGIDSKGLVTIVDYTKPSTENRLWVLDLKKNTVLYKGLVAHGFNSGGNYATRFSNRVGSAMSSLGLYMTGKPYIGHNGYSLRLIGLEKGFNDYAMRRNVVIHPASYVSRSFADAYGRIGHSAGCFALESRLSSSIIKTIKDGTLLFAYYPDSKWLKKSKYLT